jgi:hypothetical protein
MSPRIGVLAAAALAVTTAVAVPRSTPAAPASPPVRLRDHAHEVAALKHALLWREAKAGFERGAGQHIEPDVVDEDLPAGRPAPHGAAPAATTRALAAGLPNVRVNDKSHDAPGVAQSEEGIAVLGLHAVCAWNDGQGFLSADDSQNLGFTVDGGVTWVPEAILHPTGAPNRYWFSDPVVTGNEKTGEFFYAGLTLPGANQEGLSVAHGHFSSNFFDWDSVVAVRSGLSNLVLFDKEWIAADSSSGNVYLTYTVFSAAGDSILFQRSTDGGNHWSNPMVVNTSGFGNVQGSRPVVGPNGEVYVTWEEAGATADFLEVRTSTDHGVSFGPQVQVASVWGNDFCGAPGFNRLLGITFPSIAVDRSAGPHRGRAYLAWNEGLDIFGDPLGGGGAVNEAEPDNAFAGATSFAPGERLRGNLARLDLDVWKFNATQGTTYVFFGDSVGASLNYTFRVFCGLDTLTRLASTGDPDSTQSSGSPFITEWTAPTTGTYYVRMAQIAGTGSYSIATGTHTPAADDRARDQRDAFVSYSDGGSSWFTPMRVNDDDPGLDDWLPEVGVSTEGYPYAMWFDWRDGLATCAGSSNVYVSRSLDGGATWAANQRVTTATTAWSAIPSNIAPNQGDYLGLGAGGSVICAWADGRLGDPDVFAGDMTIGGASGSVACPPDSTWPQGSTHLVTIPVSHANTVFGDPFTVGLTGSRGWPGTPASQGVTAPAGSGTSAAFTIGVPDSAAPGTNRVCVRLVEPSGLAVDSCCFTITIPGGSGVPPGARAEFALREPSPNPSASTTRIAWSLPDAGPARLEIVDVAGRRRLVRDVGGRPGPQELSLDPVALRLEPGVYGVRLTHGGRTLATKLAIVR